jgi:DNA-binding MarR family transcriptional regulator
VTAPTATRAHAATAHRLRAAIARLNRMLRQQNVGELTLSQWSALIAVEVSGPLRVGDLAEREHVSAATATRLAASLEAAGLVARAVDAADRRSSVLTLTPAGAAALARAREARALRLSQRLSALAPDDLARLEAALPVLERLATDS